MYHAQIAIALKWEQMAIISYINNSYVVAVKVNILSDYIANH